MKANWIDVNDKLPEFGERVYVYNSEGHDIGYRIEAEQDGPDSMGHDAGWYCIGFGFPGRSFGNPEYMSDAIGQPTHWMPFFDPPSTNEGMSDEEVDIVFPLTGKPKSKPKAQEFSKWLGVESAPRDGTEFIGLLKDGTVFKTRWGKYASGDTWECIGDDSVFPCSKVVAWIPMPEKGSDYE